MSSPTSDAPISEEVRAFLRDHVDSFEKLEALLLLASHPGAGWSAFAVGERLGMPASLAAVTLEELRGLGLVELGAEGRYACPSTPHPLVGELAQVYDRDRLGIITFLNASALDRIRGSAARAFADAFRVRPAGKGSNGQGGKDG